MKEEHKEETELKEIPLHPDGFSEWFGAIRNVFGCGDLYILMKLETEEKTALARLICVSPDLTSIPIMIGAKEKVDYIS